MQETLRVNNAGVQAIAARWAVSADDLNAMVSPATFGLSWQPSATAVNAAHADVTVFTAALAARVGSTATHVSEADRRYLANENRSANQLASVVQPVISV
ncbi:MULTISPECIES: hypothetical protein [Mycobacterium]|uniref:hypothetical protein n=1 Tax=Mycobacterium TaxID=1763 RepID=UPI001F0BD160|nr:MULTISPECIES: hypothetical protein [Mycobacterium]MDM4141474.1 hypothetical protein [Mycobacterium sp. FLAC0960]